MIADYADKLNSYEEFKDYADMVQQFIQKTERGEPSRRQIRPKNGIFAFGAEIYHQVHWKVHRWNPIRNTATFSIL